MSAESDKYVLIPDTKNDDWDDDLEALTYLTQFNIEPSNDGMFRIPASRSLSFQEGKALDYLCDEWDYGVLRI